MDPMWIGLAAVLAAMTVGAVLGTLLYLFVTAPDRRDRR